MEDTHVWLMMRTAATAARSAGLSTTGRARLPGRRMEASYFTVLEKGSVKLCRLPVVTFLKARCASERAKPALRLYGTLSLRETVLQISISDSVATGDAALRMVTGVAVGVRGSIA